MSTEDTIFYTKSEDGTFIPVKQYNDEVMNAMPTGTHVVVVAPYRKSYRYNIQPDLAPMVAAVAVLAPALLELLDEMAQPAMPADTTVPVEDQVELRKAWENLVRIGGSRFRTISMPSRHDVAEKILERFAEIGTAAHKHPAVQAAYSQYQMVCQLAIEEDLSQ